MILSKSKLLRLRFLLNLLPPSKLVINKIIHLSAPSTAVTPGCHVFQRSRSPLPAADRPIMPRVRSPVHSENVMPEPKKSRPSEPPPPDNSDDEKSDQDLVVDEVNDVSYTH